MASITRPGYFMRDCERERTLWARVFWNAYLVAVTVAVVTVIGWGYRDAVPTQLRGQSVKNHELEQLTQRARAIVDDLPLMYLTGDGEFLQASTGIAMPSSDVLAMVTRARRNAAILANTLEQTPRRKVGKAETAE